jgi:hypothetical protein
VTPVTPVTPVRNRRPEGAAYTHGMKPNEDPTSYIPPTYAAPPPPTRPHRPFRSLAYAAGLIVALAIGLGAGAGAASSHTTQIQTRDVPGPTVTKTVTVAPPPPPPGTPLGRWSGSGSQVTPAFNAPSNGDYIVSWTFSGNTDPSFGGAANFIINANDQQADAFSLPNVIAANGSGSTEVTGATGVESFSVQADGSWTIKVTTAP